MENSTEELIKLIKAHPDLPIIPMVDQEVVADDCCTYWLGHWGRSEVKGYYKGRDYVHFSDDDEGDVLRDMVGCEYGCDKEGNDIYDLSDEEWDALYKSIPWINAIVVYITT